MSPLAKLKKQKHFFVFPILGSWLVFFLYQLLGYSIAEWAHQDSRNGANHELRAADIIQIQPSPI